MLVKFLTCSNKCTKHTRSRAFAKAISKTHVNLPDSRAYLPAAGWFVGLVKDLTVARLSVKTTYFPTVNFYPIEKRRLQHVANDLLGWQV